MLVVGHNHSSVTRLSGIVRDYVDAKIDAITGRRNRQTSEARAACGCCICCWSAAEAAAAVRGVKRVIVVRFALDTSLGAKLKLGAGMAAEDSLTCSGRHLL